MLSRVPNPFLDWVLNRKCSYCAFDAYPCRKVPRSRYKTAVSAELGEMKQADVPDEFKTSFDYLTSPIGNRAIGDGIGEKAIDALVQAKRVDLIENVLKGFNPSGRVYAALALLKLSKGSGLVLSTDTISTIAKVSNLDISIYVVRGCLVSSQTASDILSESEESDPAP